MDQLHVVTTGRRMTALLAALEGGRPVAVPFASIDSVRQFQIRAIPELFDQIGEHGWITIYSDDHVVAGITEDADLAALGEMMQQ